MGGFVKLDVGILESTLWSERDLRDVFLTALLMASPIEFKTEVAQLEVDSTQETGWKVPAGWYGFVPAAGVGIVRRAMIDSREAGMKALRVLGSPEPESRSPDFEGRRLVRVNGGFVVLNFTKYRDRDYTAAERSKRWRDRVKKLAAVKDPVPDDTRDRCDDTRDVTQAEREAEAEAELLTKSETEREPSRKGEAPAVSWPDSVPVDLRSEWAAVRKSKGLVKVTQRVLDAVLAEGFKAGMSPYETLTRCCEEGWGGFKAAWLSGKNTRRILK